MSGAEQSLIKLQQYCEGQDYRGFDPYDALKSPLFKAGIFKTNKLLRFGAQQLVKRSPLNLRGLLGVPKGYNPVSLGLFIQGYAYRSVSDPGRETYYLDKIRFLINELKHLIPEGFSGACWGYDFDWEARHAKIPAYQPTVVATGIIVNGLYEAWEITELPELKALILDSSNFILKDLKRTYDGESFCFSYSPFDHQRVFNASMKGARLLSQAYALSGEALFKETACQAVAFVAKHQRADGAWGYSLASEGGWIDNYHTGYVLDCLKAYITLTGDKLYNENLEKGFRFYGEHFITTEGIPKFYANKLYPVDCTAASQTILTLSGFGAAQQAENVAVWMANNMQAANGSFYFRKYKLFTEKISFMRWSNAWMFAALSFLEYTLKTKKHRL